MSLEDIKIANPTKIMIPIEELVFVPVVDISSIVTTAICTSDSKFLNQVHSVFL